MREKETVLKLYSSERRKRFDGLDLSVIGQCLTVEGVVDKGGHLFIKSEMKMITVKP